MTSELKDKEEKINQLSQKIIENNNFIKENNNNLQLLQEENLKLQQNIKNKDKEYSDISLNLKQKKQKWIDDKQQLAEKLIQTHNQEISSYKNQILENQKAYQNEKEQNIQSLQQLNLKIERLQQEKNEYQNQQQILQQLYQELEKENQYKKDLLEEKQEEVKNLQDNYKQYEYNLSNKENQCKELEQQILQLSNKVQENEQFISQQNKEMKQMIDEKSQILTQKNNLEQNYIHLEDKVKEKDLQVQNIQEDLFKQKQECQLIQQKNKDMQIRLSENNYGKSFFINQLSGQNTQQGINFTLQNGILYTQVDKVVDQQIKVFEKSGQLKIEYQKTQYNMDANQKNQLQQQISNLEKQDQECSTDLNISYIQTQALAQSFILKNSQAVIYMLTEDFNSKHLFELQKLKEILYQNQQPLYIIHNFKDTESIENIKRLIETNIFQSFNIDITSRNELYEDLPIKEFDLVNNKKMVQHFVLAKEGSEAAEIYNRKTLDFFNQIQQFLSMPQKTNNFIKSFKNYINQSFYTYYQIQNEEYNVDFQYNDEKNCFEDINISKIHNLICPKQNILDYLGQSTQEMVKNQDYFHINYVLFSPQNIENIQKNQGQQQEENLEQDSESDDQNENNDQNKIDQSNFYNYKIYFTSPFLVDVKDNLEKCIKWKISTDQNIKKKCITIKGQNYLDDKSQEQIQLQRYLKEQDSTPQYHQVQNSLKKGQFLVKIPFSDMSYNILTNRISIKWDDIKQIAVIQIPFTL